MATNNANATENWLSCMNNIEILREDRNALDDDVFRDQWRTWIKENYHSPLRDPLHRLTGKAARAWLGAQYRDGWRAPGLSTEYGGMGLSLRKQLIYQEELESHGVARPMDMGLRLLAPVLVRYGTPEQQARYLPRILSGDEVWCQGYSEPNAGSDLANLKMSAKEHDDHFILEGQKTWTTMASDSDWIFLLARTSTEARKQQGITFFMADLRSPGIRVVPIRTLAGDKHFCEVFFDGVKVSKDQVVGAVGGGWSVGKALLGFERFSHGSPELVRHVFSLFKRTGQALGMQHSERYRMQLERYACDVADACALYEQVCEAALAGHNADDEFSMLKLFNSEIIQRMAESASELAGQRAGILGLVPDIDIDLDWLYMVTRPLTIFGGTAQVQRNLIATRTLAMPRS